MSASLAVVPPPPLVLQMHSGSQVSEPTAARRMKRQSLALGSVPVVTGCEQTGSDGNVVVLPETVEVVVPSTVVVVAP